MTRVLPLVCLLLAGSHGFAPCHQQSQTSSSRFALIDEADMTADQREILSISKKWSEVRMMSREEAGSLDAEWKEAHTRFYDKYDSDMETMTEIAEKLEKMIEPPKVEKKSKGQRKRDAHARRQAVAAARAAAL